MRDGEKLFGIIGDFLFQTNLRADVDFFVQKRFDRILPGEAFITQRDIRMLLLKCLTYRKQEFGVDAFGQTDAQRGSPP